MDCCPSFVSTSVSYTHLDVYKRQGRVRVIEVLSLSFSEYLLFKDEKLWRLQQELKDGNDDALVAPLQQDVYKRQG